MDKRGLCLLSTAAAVLLFQLAAAQMAFFGQEESAQHLLQAEGDRFRVFRHNTICNNWDFARYENEIKTDPEPALRLLDKSPSDAVLFHSHNPIACRPLTRYQVRFKYNLLSFESGPPPSVEIQLFDFNRDYAGSLTWPVPVEQSGMGWVEARHEFDTGYDIHAMMLFLRSETRTVCDLVFDEVFIEQRSGAGAMMPEERTLISNEAVLPGEEVRVELHDTSEAFTLSFDVAWDEAKVDAEVALEWLDHRGRGVARQYARFSRFHGVRPEWNGVHVQWFREHGDSADKVPLQRDRFFSMRGEAGQGSVERLLRRPDGAEKVRLTFSTRTPQNIQVRNFLLTAYEVKNSVKAEAVHE